MMPFQNGKNSLRLNWRNWKKKEFPHILNREFAYAAIGAAAHFETSRAAVPIFPFFHPPPPPQRLNRLKDFLFLKKKQTKETFIVFFFFQEDSRLLCTAHTYKNKRNKLEYPYAALTPPPPPTFPSSTHLPRMKPVCLYLHSSVNPN